MRKNFILFITLSALLLLSGCGAAAVGAIPNLPPEANPEATVSQDVPPAPKLTAALTPSPTPSPLPEPTPPPTPAPTPSPAPEPPPSPTPAPTPSPALEPTPAPTPEASAAPEPPPPTEEPAPTPCAPTKLTVLMYHHLVADGEPIVGMTITAGRFAEDMWWLKDNGYTTVLPRELAAGAPLPEKAVMVTFDDGYASNYLYAFPVLKDLEMKAAIAVVGRVVDAYDFNTLDWDMCREMNESGLVEIGSHTYDLHNLDDSGGDYVSGGSNGIQRREGETREEYEARVLTDLQKSIDVIEEELGTSVTFLAYPYGAKDDWAAGFIADHFSVTLLTKSGVADLSKGLYSLPRKTVTMDRSAAACFR